jgi:hypothetical protein
MSTLKTNNVQVGQSVTATNNFTIYQPSTPDGTVRIGVGNSGATTADVLTANSSGNVGIGTSSPAGRLHARFDAGVGDSFTAKYIFQTTDQALFIKTNWQSGVGQYSTVEASNAANTTITELRLSGTPLALYTSGSERARIDSSGNLLVGVTSQLYGERLNVTRGGSGNNAATFYFDTSDDRAAVIVRHAGASGGTSRKQLAFLDSGGTERGSISSTGSATAYTTSSDYRLKHDITPMQNALATVAQLKPVTYKWNADNSESQGFIAHELQTVVPDCVTGGKDAVDADGNPVYQGIDTSFLVATLTAAIQEQQAMIEELRAKVAALEGAKG